MKKKIYFVLGICTLFSLVFGVLKIYEEKENKKWLQVREKVNYSQFLDPKEEIIELLREMERASPLCAKGARA